jgi:hypothetical protein
MTDAHQMELLSRAYVQVVAAAAGCSCARPDPDYGTDMTLRQIDAFAGAYGPVGPNVDFQLKATTAATVTDTEIVYDLEVRAYELLRRTTRRAPVFLVLLVLPNEKGEWIEQDEERLEVRRCAYWLLLHRYPAVENESTVRVRIPRTNVFTPDALLRIMKSVLQETDP